MGAAEHSSRRARPARRGRRAISAVAVGSTLLASSVAASVVPGSAQAAGHTLRVVGNQLTRDGALFVPRGFTSIAVLAGPGCPNPDAASARAMYTPAEFPTLAGSWHANTIRFQVSQWTLSSTDGPTVAAYLGTIAAAVTDAHASGLAVILSVQDQQRSCGLSHPMPSEATRLALGALAPPFASDHDVMFELFNEPVNDTASDIATPLPAADWTQWRDGGQVPEANLGDLAIGHQTLVNYVRSLGVTNPLLVDGLKKAAVLPGPDQGAALLTDTMVPANLVYAVHPYSDVDGQASWDFRYGDVAGTVPVVATEWNYLTDQCGKTKQLVAAGFLAYLSDRGIGVLGFASDSAIGTGIMADTSWNPTLCGAGPDGPGAVFADYLRRNAGLRPADATLTGPTTAAEGDAVALAGTLTVDGIPAVSGMRVEMRRQDSSGSVLFTTTTTAADGTFAATDPTGGFAGSVVYTATYPGNAVTTPASHSVTVTVIRPRPSVAPAHDFDGDGFADLVARDSKGVLWLYPGLPGGDLGTRRQMGTGWSSMTALVAAGDLDGDRLQDLVARNSSGRLLLYPGTGTGLLKASREIATGWGSMTAVVGAGDLDGNGTADLVARDKAGTLWLYPGNGTGGLLARRSLGTGWSSMSLIVPSGPFGAPGGLLARQTSTGQLWLYPGNGTGGLLARRALGTGWKNLNALVGGASFTSDSTPDLVARQAKTGEVWLYPGIAGGTLGPRRLIATAWGSLTAIA